MKSMPGRALILNVTQTHPEKHSKLFLILSASRPHTHATQAVSEKIKRIVNLLKVEKSLFLHSWF